MNTSSSLFICQIQYIGIATIEMHRSRSACDIHKITACVNMDNIMSLCVIVFSNL